MACVNIGEEFLRRRADLQKSVCVLFGTVIILAACSSNDVHNGAIENEKVEEVEVEQVETGSAPEQEVENEDDQEESETTDQEQEVSAQGEEFPEYEKITEIVNIADHTVQTVTDNEGKRILLFIDNDGEKQYKSIFIKHDERLKVIELNGGGQIFNERIG